MLRLKIFGSGLVTKEFDVIQFIDDRKVSSRFPSLPSIRERVRVGVPKRAIQNWRQFDPELDQL
jgi:hypothetical protein